jgi:hypothetical protein
MKTIIYIFLTYIFSAFCLADTVSNYMIFGAVTTSHSEVKETIEEEYLEIGIVGSVRNKRHLFKVGASTKLVENNKLRTDYLYYQYDIPNTNQSIKLGQINNTLGLLNEGIFNPSVRYTILPSQVAYWTSVRGLGASVKGLMWELDGDFFKGTPFKVQASYGKPLINIEHLLTHDVVPRGLPNRGHTKFGNQFYFNGRIEGVNHSLKYSTSYLGFENEFAKNKYLLQSTLGYRYENTSLDVVLELYHLKAKIFSATDYQLPGIFDWYKGDSHGVNFHVDWFARNNLSFYLATNLLHLNSSDRYGNKGKLQEISELTGITLPPAVTYTRTQTVGVRYDITHKLRLQLEYQKTWGNYANKTTFDLNTAAAASIDSLNGESWGVTSLSLIFTTF